MVMQEHEIHENPRSGTPTLHEISPEICEKFSKET